MSKPVMITKKGKKYVVKWEARPPKLDFVPGSKDVIKLDELEKTVRMHERSYMQQNQGGKPLLESDNSDESKALKKQIMEAWAHWDDAVEEIKKGTNEAELKPSDFPHSLNWKKEPILEDGSKIKVGTFLTDAVKASYMQAIKLNNPSAPGITNTELKLSILFMIVWKVEAGVTSFILTPAPDLNSLAPSLGADRSKTGIYKLDLTFPMLTDATSDPRKIIYTERFGSGYVSVEEPYSEPRYNEIVKKAKGSAGPSKGHSKGQ